MNKLKISFLLAATLLVTAVHAQNAKISLNSLDGQEWTITPQANVPNVTGQQISKPGYKLKNSIPAVVPGCVFTSYVNAGKVADPNYGDNIYKVDEKLFNRPFWYRTEFRTPKFNRQGQHVWIHFDNINRYAAFYVNGVKISGRDSTTRDVSGHMMRSQYDITPLLRKSGKNAVAVLITDADQKKTRTGKDPYGVACSPSYLAGAGWDWMPYVPGRLNGITGYVYLTVSGDVVMRDPWVRSELPSNDEAKIFISSEIKNTSSSEKNITVSGTIQPGNIAFKKQTSVLSDSTAKISITPADCQSLVINNPKLWWPNGYGEPNLYTCHLECQVDGKISDSRDIRFGIRKYEYRLSFNSISYPVFTLYVNGKRIFVKGGDWGMSEYLLRCHGKEYETRIKLHKDLNYNMIRLWTGCVTDEEFYDYCDENGIMVWDDFWLYVAYNDVAEHDSFKANAKDKVRRLRNHACIAVWCGANETHPVPDLDFYLRNLICEEDHNDRIYKSCSNQDALSGSGWWGNMPPRHHFETSGSNLAFNNPPYPYSDHYGYGFRTEIGMATFPTYESVKLFIPRDSLWPLPTDEQLKNDDNTVWNKHFFGKEASNAQPINYKKSVNSRYGESQGIEEFCEKAQLINLEDMKGMYEAWNDKMWNDASGLMIWMSSPAYPSFVWQTYDYYFDPTGAYWGAKKACEPIHIQWNCLTNSVKVINTTGEKLTGLTARMTVYNINGKQVPSLSQTSTLDVDYSNTAEAFVIDFSKAPDLTPLSFLKLELTDAQGKLLSTNFYWLNRQKELDYHQLNSLPETNLTCTVSEKNLSAGKFSITLKNNSSTVAFANRIRLLNPKTGERILPYLMTDNYITLMPGEDRTLQVKAPANLLKHGCNIMVKQYRQAEKKLATL